MENTGGSWKLLCQGAVGPVAHRLLVVDLLPQPVDHLGGRPLYLVPLLLVVHRVEHRHDPVLEEAVVLVGRQQVANAVDAPASQVEPLEREVAQVRGAQALDEVLRRTCEETRLVGRLERKKELKMARFDSESHLSGQFSEVSHVLMNRFSAPSPLRCLRPW